MLQGFRNGEPEYLQVQNEACVIDVPYVQCKLLLPGEGITPVDLCPSRYSRADFMPPGLKSVISPQVSSEQGSRSYEAHVSFQHVQELGKLVKACASEEFTKRGETMFVGKKLSVLVSFIGHGPEFVHSENLSVQARTRLLEKYRFP